jgi:large-conductance mechanosensitive channel
MINKKLNRTFFILSQVILLFLSLAILLFIAIITIKLICETDNPSLFDIDFDKKEHIVSSYGTLIGSLLTFLSIIFVIYTIIQQKNQYDNDKRLEKEKEKNALFDRLKLIHNLLNKISTDITNTGYEMKSFFKKEKEKPLDDNYMKFYPNRNYYRLLELDYQLIFSAFQEFSNDEDKTKSFNDLYEEVDFYSESILEQKEKYQYHMKDKFERKQNILSELKCVISEASKMIEDYVVELSENNGYEQNNWYKLLSELINLYSARISKNDEVNFEIIEKEVLSVFISKAEQIDFENKTRDLIINIASIRNKLNSLKMESMCFGEQMERRYNDYYSPESKSFKNLNELKMKISCLIESKVLKNKFNNYEQ